jgi:hypothetical protein
MVTKYAGFRWISSTNAAVGGRGRYRESGGSLIVRALGPVDSELDLHLKHWPQLARAAQTFQRPKMSLKKSA